MKHYQKGRWWQIPKQSRYYYRKWTRGDGIDWGKCISFRDFVSYLEQTPAERLDGHWRPQSHYLADNRFDVVGRFESLEQDFQRVCDRIGLTAELPSCRRSTRTRKDISGHCFADWLPPELRSLQGVPPWQQFYTAEPAERVARIYRCDMEAFGYEIPAEMLSADWPCAA